MEPSFKVTLSITTPLFVVYSSMVSVFNVPDNSITPLCPPTNNVTVLLTLSLISKPLKLACADALTIFLLPTK